MNNSLFVDSYSEISIEEEERLIFFAKGIPVIVFLAVVCLIGTFGNILTFTVYAVGFKQSIHRTFILCLGLVDLVACLVSIPYVIYDNIHPYTHTSAWTCKIMKFIQFAFAAYSFHFLGVIAVERYICVCKPFARQLTAKNAQIISVVIGVFVLLICCPIFEIYGVTSTVSDINRIQGFQCSVIPSYKASLYETLYFDFLFSVVILLSLICVVLYSLIWRKLMASEQFRKAKSAGRFQKGESMRISAQVDRKAKVNVEDRIELGSKEIVYTDFERSMTSKLSNRDTRGFEPKIATNTLENTSLQTGRNLKNCELKETIMDTENYFSGEGSQNRVSKDYNISRDTKNECVTNDTHCTNPVNPFDEVKSVVRCNVSKEKQNRMIDRSKRLTWMFLVVSVLSFVVYLPYFVYVMLRNINNELLLSFGAFGPIMRYSFFLNNALNPIVYGFMDKNVYDQFKSMVRPFKRSKAEHHRIVSNT